MSEGANYRQNLEAEDQQKKKEKKKVSVAIPQESKSAATLLT